MNLKLYMKAKSSTALGPYNRYILWVQGCKRHCKGCIAKDSWDINSGENIDINELSDEIINAPNIEGITISGGEPYLQSDALCKLLDKVKQNKNLGVIIYTGFLFDEILDDKLTSYADIIIDGEYVDELNDNLSLRGSSNQKIIDLTGRYKKIIPQYYGVKGRKTELYINKDKIQLIGIPNKENLKLFGEEN